jgi:hypothetical protein
VTFTEETVASENGVARCLWHRALSFRLAMVLIVSANSPKAWAPTFTSLTGMQKNSIELKDVCRCGSRSRQQARDLIAERRDIDFLIEAAIAGI